MDVAEVDVYHLSVSVKRNLRSESESESEGRKKRAFVPQVLFFLLLLYGLYSKYSSTTPRVPS
jgi:hypothetical protein